MGQVFGFAAGRGAKIDGKIDFAKLRSTKRKKVRARNARAKLRFEIFEQIFRAPPFINCAAWDDLNTPGPTDEALVYRLLFPDLFSPTTRSPMGNRFYTQFKPIVLAAGATETGLGSHAIRHLFGAQLKKKGVTEEDRGELLGHAGKTETSERYCEPHEIAFLAKLVKRLPKVTAHLEPHPIRLLPWVKERRRPPFSRPSKSKKP